MYENESCINQKKSKVWEKNDKDAILTEHTEKIQGSSII